MNVEFGLILNKKIDLYFSAIPKEVKEWGGDFFEDGDVKLVSRFLDGAFFTEYPVTEFILSRIDSGIDKDDISYLSIGGAIVDEYEDWINNNSILTKDTHVVEVWLLKIISEVGWGAIMFAPEGDRLEDFFDVSCSDLIVLIRKNVKNMWESKGFLAKFKYGVC